MNYEDFLRMQQAGMGSQSSLLAPEGKMQDQAYLRQAYKAQGSPSEMGDMKDVQGILGGKEGMIMGMMSALASGLSQDEQKNQASRLTPASVGQWNPAPIQSPYGKSYGGFSPIMLQSLLRR